MGKRIIFAVLLLLPCQAQAGIRKLQQSLPTTVEIHLVNASTGVGITGATVTSITAFVKKHSDTSSATKTDLTITASGGSNDSVSVGLGAYNLEITAANTDTLGGLTLCYSYTAAVTTCDTYEVSAVSDPQFAGDYGNIPDILAEACADITVEGSWGKRLCDFVTGPTLRYTEAGTSDSGSTTTMVDAARTEADTDHWAGSSIVFTSGAIIGQARRISGFTPGTDTLTFYPATTQAVSTESYEIRAIPGSLALELATVQSDTDDLQAKLGTPAGASLSADVAAVKVDSAAIKVKTDFTPSVTSGAAGGLFVAGVNAATTITTGLTTTFTGNLTGSVASVTGAVGSVTGNVGGNVTGNVTGSVGAMTAAALAQFFTVNSGTTYASAVAGSVVKEIVTNGAGSALTIPNIVSGVWDAATASYQIAGSTGKALTDAASAGDPWSTAVPGAYVAGSAGYILGTNINATVTSRASQSTLDTLQADADDIQTRLPASLLAGRIDSHVGSMAASVITEAAINSGAFSAPKFADDAKTAFAATLMATTFEGVHTLKHFLQYGASALFGKYNSASGTFNFRDLADTKNRIIYATSSTARTAVALSPD